MDDLSVRTYVRACVRASVCPVHCGKTADRIRLPFGIIGRTGPGMRQIVGFGYRSSGRGTFGDQFGARHCNQWGLYGVRVRQRRDAALFPNYFGETVNIAIATAVNMRPFSDIAFDYIFYPDLKSIGVAVFAIYQNCLFILFWLGCQYKSVEKCQDYCTIWQYVSVTCCWKIDEL